MATIFVPEAVLSGAEYPNAGSAEMWAEPADGGGVDLDYQTDASKCIFYMSVRKGPRGAYHVSGKGSTYRKDAAIRIYEWVAANRPELIAP